MVKKEIIMRYDEIKNDLQTKELWKVFFVILEMLDDKNALKEFTKNKMQLPGSRYYQVNIKEYFDHCKNVSLVKRISLETYRKAWFIISELRQDYFYPFAIVGAIGGSPIFGGSGRKAYNIIRVPIKGRIALKNFSINGKLTILNRRGMVSLLEVKEHLDSLETQKKPKNLKTYLKELIAIANEDIFELRGYDSLTEDQKSELLTAIGGLQNSLGDELSETLSKYSLEWE